MNEVTYLVYRDTAEDNGRCKGTKTVAMGILTNTVGL